MTAAALLLAAFAAGASAAKAPAPAAAPPDVPPDLSTAPWANTAGPLSLSALRGRVVLLEFSDEWSGEGLRALLRSQVAQARYPDAVALVSVRTREGGDAGGRASLEREALRERIQTPLVEDPGRVLARAYGVSRLPAQVVLDARGRFARRLGPGDDESALPKTLEELVARARAQHELWTSTGPASPAWDSYAEGPLAFPTGLAFDEKTGRLAVCDTGHDRVVIADASGRVKLVAGVGAPSYRDGPAAEAALDRPRAASFSGGQLGIADAANDYIRVLELKKPRVESWFGDVKALRWPASLLIDGRSAYFGSSATHVLWAVDLKAAHRYSLAGDGVAGDRDGLPPVSRLREPGALAELADTLYVADPEAGRLRAISLSTPSLTTPALAGPGAPLRRPTALAALDGLLYIADAGDGALKRLDPASGRVVAIAAGLRHPAGLAAARGELLVAETDTSRLLRFSPEGRALGELRLRGLRKPPSGPVPPPLPTRAPAETLPEQAVRAGADDALEIRFDLPEGMILNPRAPAAARVIEALGVVKVPLESRRAFSLPPRQPLRLRFTPAEGAVTLTVDVEFFYCRKDRKGLCFAASKRYLAPLSASASTKARVARVTARP